MCTQDTIYLQILNGLISDRAASAESFLWLVFPKKNWDRGEGVSVSVTKTELEYCYEFIPRTYLYQTALTRQAYTTSAFCSRFCLHAAFSGPAGTGKTETGKDFAMMCGQNTVVTNMGENVDSVAISGIIKGTAASNSFTMMDEFNRCSLDAILQA